MIRSRYDPDADAAYFYLTDGKPHESEDVAPGVTLDFDKEGRVVGMEVLDASKTLAPGPWIKTLYSDQEIAAAE
jgi:uncharacterized protein YuzE